MSIRMDVALQIPAFKEDDLTSTMDAWVDQPVPDGVNISYEAWITPSDDPKHRCGTWRQGEAHDVFEAFEAPQYKLVARNVAHESAFERGFDAFIVADADAPPLRDSTLSALIDGISDENTVAAVSNPVCDPTPIGLWSNMGVYGKEFIGAVHGQCHAVTHRGWSYAGPLSEDVDHTEVISVWFEEEYGFGQRLHDAGNVDYRFDAPVYNDTRRRECGWYKSWGRDHEFCERVEGDETFAPELSK